MFEIHRSLAASQLVQTLVMRLWHFCVSFIADIKLKPSAIRFYWTFQMFTSKLKRKKHIWMEGSPIKCWWESKHVLATRSPDKNLLWENRDDWAPETDNKDFWRIWVSNKMFHHLESKHTIYLPTCSIRTPLINQVGDKWWIWRLIN